MQSVQEKYAPKVMQSPENKWILHPGTDKFSQRKKNSIALRVLFHLPSFLLYLYLIFPLPVIQHHWQIPQYAILFQFPRFTLLYSVSICHASAQGNSWLLCPHTISVWWTPVSSLGPSLCHYWLPILRHSFFKIFAFCFQCALG